MHTLENIIFDLGGVIIDWDPKRLYRKIFDTETAVDFFLQNICTSDWNEMQDAGRSLAEGTQILVEQHPNYRAEIEAFYGRWEEMLGGLIDGTVQIAKRLHQQDNLNLFALTNWSAETFPIAEKRYDIFKLFDGVLVSGKEKLKKPDPKIYLLLMARYGLVPDKCLFIDDNLRNVLAAQKLGMHVIHLKKEVNLEVALKEYNLF